MTCEHHFVPFPHRTTTYCEWCGARPDVSPSKPRTSSRRREQPAPQPQLDLPLAPENSIVDDREIEAAETRIEMAMKYLDEAGFDVTPLIEQLREPPTRDPEQMNPSPERRTVPVDDDGDDSLGRGTNF